MDLKKIDREQRLGLAMLASTQNTGSLTSFIQKIGSHGVPSKFVTKDLPAWGFKSSHDRSIVAVLRQIGFLDSSGTPTDLWREARTKPGEAVAKGVRAGYADLFAMFPDAHRKDTESLTNFFKAKTDSSEAGVKQIVGTFKALTQLGSFTESDKEEYVSEPTAQEARLASTDLPSSTFSLNSRNGLAVNMNIELSLPADSTGEIYERFFAAMRKHLIDATE